MRVSVCIATYGRPAGLERLLTALQALEFRTVREPELRVVVVDNHSDCTARPVVDRLRNASRWPIDYHHETSRGIAYARNAALRATAGTADLIAFIDDDEEPEPLWLEELLAAYHATGATAVGGPVRARFAGAIPGWAVRGGFFDTQRPPCRDGSLTEAFTGNVLIDRRVLAAVGLAFDERLALIGAEDTLLFRQLREAGHRIAWAEAAVVHEWVPQSRANLGWLFRRWYRTGYTDSLLHARQRSVGRAAVENLLRALARIGVGTLLLVLTCLVAGLGSRHRIVRRMYTICRGFGMLAGVFRRPYHEYATVHTG